MHYGSGSAKAKVEIPAVPVTKHCLPHSLPPSLVSKLDRQHTGRLRKKDERGRGMAEVKNAKLYDGEKAWRSINHSIISDLIYSNKLPVVCEKM